MPPQIPARRQSWSHRVKPVLVGRQPRAAPPNPMVASFMDMLALTLRASGCAAEACSGQPRACPVPTPKLGSTRPEQEAHWQHSTLAFFNAATTPVALDWLAGNGSVKSHVGVVRPGATRRVSATTGDVFSAVSTTDGTLLMEYLTSPSVVRACECDDTPLVLCPPRAPSSHNASERPQYEPAGFLNQAGSPIDIYMNGRDCEHLLTAEGMEHGRQVYFASWFGQQFRARLRSSGQLLLEHTVGQVIIRPCTGSQHRQLGATRPELGASRPELGATRRVSASSSSADDSMPMQQHVEHLEGQVT